MVGNEEFFKKFRALIILFLISTPRIKKRMKKAFSPMLCHGPLKLKVHCKYIQWNLGHREKLYTEQVFAVCGTMENSRWHSKPLYFQYAVIPLH